MINSYLRYKMPGYTFVKNIKLKKITAREKIVWIIFYGFLKMYSRLRYFINFKSFIHDSYLLLKVILRAIFGNTSSIFDLWGLFWLFFIFFLLFSNFFETFLGNLYTILILYFSLHYDL